MFGDFDFSRRSFFLFLLSVVAPSGTHTSTQYLLDMLFGRLLSAIMSGPLVSRPILHVITCANKRVHSYDVHRH